MTNISVFSSLLSPQLKVIESANANRILPLQSHVHIYLIGTSTIGPSFEPTVVSSVVDFTNQFGFPGNNIDAQTTLDCVRIIYANDSTANLYFIRVGNDSSDHNNYITGINSLEVEDEYPGGFLIAPSAFRHITDEAERVAVGNALIAKAEEQDFMAIIDPRFGISYPGAPASVPIADANKYTGVTRGHAAYYYPYLRESISGKSRAIPPSCVAASVATARFKVEGFKPGAGLKYPVKGVSGPTMKVTRALQDELDPAGINAIRKIRNQGTVIWGMRTRTNAVLYRYFHYRVIANVVNRTFRKSIDLKRQLFDVIDGQGQLFAYLEEAANSVGRQLYQSGLLFGATEVDAFAAKCDFENNTPEMIQQGFVLVEFTYSISPAVDKMVVNSRLTGVGTVNLANETGVALDGTEGEGEGQADADTP